MRGRRVLRPMAAGSRTGYILSVICTCLSGFFCVRVQPGGRCNCDGQVLEGELSKSRDLAVCIAAPAVKIFTVVAERREMYNYGNIHGQGQTWKRNIYELRISLMEFRCPDYTGLTYDFSRLWSNIANM